MIAYRRPHGACRKVLQTVSIVLIGGLVAPSTMAEAPEQSTATEMVETAGTGSASDTSESVEKATRTVELLHEALDDLMQGEGDFDERMARALEAVRTTFHMQRVARAITGAGWRRLDDEQRHELRVALADLIAAFYAYQFFSDRGDGFATLSHEEVGDGRVIVRTELQRADKDNISLVYHLTEALIFNVVVNGVSDMSLRRAQYGAIFREEGFDGLLARINQQIEKHRAEGTDA